MALPSIASVTMSTWGAEVIGPCGHKLEIGADYRAWCPVDLVLKKVEETTIKRHKDHKGYNGE